MLNVCATDQNVLIEWLRRKSNAKIPSISIEFPNHVVPVARLKAEPNLVQYLVNKGQSEGDISTYLGFTVAVLVDYTSDEVDCTVTVIIMLFFFRG